MEKSCRTLIIITAAFLIAVTAFICIAGTNYPAGFELAGIPIHSSYDYEVSITADGDLEDVTLMIPLPSTGGSTPAGNRIVMGQGYGLPDSWTVIIVGTEKKTLLKITTDRIPATGKPFIFGASVSNDTLINTRLPVGNTTLLTPIADLRKTETGAAYVSHIYAKYNASPETEIAIGITLNGKNEWWGQRTGNKFTNTVRATLKGECDGWQPAEGLVTAGLGKYSLF